MKKSKKSIYTKTGDGGNSGLIGGTRVPKNDIRLEAFGTVDELNSNIGCLRSWEINDDTKETIIRIQKQLFTIGSYLATDHEVTDFHTKLNINEKEILFLEKEIDKLEAELTPLTNFILPGGHKTVAQSHICRSVCRRAERRIIEMSKHYTVNAGIIKYLNRLSDYFFVLARYFSKYFNIDEIPWAANLQN